MINYTPQMMNQIVQQYTQPIQTKNRKKGVYDFKERFPEGITLSWNISAFIETKSNIISKIKNKCKRGKKEDDQTSPPVSTNPNSNNYNNYYQALQQQQQTQAQNTNIKQILKNVQGVVRPGQICAIMGASGAGKTTLLNILNFRNRGNLNINEEIRVNGQLVETGDIPEYSGYVQQLDLFIGTLTVREQLTLYAMLRMDRKFTTEEKQARVDEIINQLNLYKCQNTKIGMGDLSKGISGGEKRRLAFASEILNNPPLLFADEPTSGLDTFMALTVTDILANFAKEGKTIICTIHQPSSQIFEKFDTLCLLSEGRVAFMGPRKEAYNFFSRLGFRCPLHYNPGDYYVQVLAIRPTMRQEGLAKSKRICDSFETSEYKKTVDNIIAETNRKGSQAKKSDIKYPWYYSSYLTQIRWLLWREGLNVLRNPIATYILIGQTLFLGVYFGLAFLQLKLDEKGVQNYSGVLFLMLMQVNFANVFSVINSYPQELPILYREVKNRTYSIFTYTISKLVVEMPKYILFPFVFLTIVYWLTGISNSVSVYFILVAIYTLSAQIAIAFGQFLAVIAPNADAAIALPIPIFIPLLIFAGLFLNNDSTPDYLLWVKYISWFYYTYESASIEFWTTKTNIPCTQVFNASDTCLASRCFRNGDDVLENFFHINKSNVSRDIGLMFVLLFVFRALALLILKIRTSGA